MDGKLYEMTGAKIPKSPSALLICDLECIKGVKEELTANILMAASLLIAPKWKSVEAPTLRE